MLRAEKKIKYNKYKEEVSIITEILEFRTLRLKALVHRNVIKLLRKEKYVVKIREGVFELERSSIIDIVIIIIIIITIIIIIISVFVFFLSELQVMSRNRISGSNQVQEMIELDGNFLIHQSIPRTLDHDDKRNKRTPELAI